MATGKDIPNGCDAALAYRIDEEQGFESTNLDLQEGLGSESTELTSSTLESTRGVLESTSTEHSLTGRTLKRRKQSSQKGITSYCVFKCYNGGPYIGLKK